MSLVREASECFSRGDFVRARELYVQVGSILGEENFKVNISLCDESLRNAENPSLDEGRLLRGSARQLNDYFDHVYMVSLEKDVSRRLATGSHLKSFGVNFTVFPAINGYEGEPFRKFEEYSNRKLGDLKRYPNFSEKEIRRGKPYIESAGAIGYIYTYINIIKDAKANGFDRIFIIEDDVLLHPDFDVKFKRFVGSICQDWKVLQLGASQYNWSSVDLHGAEEQGFYHPRLLDTCGSFSIALDSSIYDELIEAENAFEGPFDHLPLGEVYEKHLGKCFVSFPNIVMPDVSTSNIRGGRCQFQHGERMKWNVAEFQYPLSKPLVGIFIEKNVDLRALLPFTRDNTLPFSLALFSYSEDGVRPLHDETLAESGLADIGSGFGENLTLDIDYCARIRGDVTGSIEDVTRYIENKVDGGDRVTSLADVEFVKSAVVSGRVSVIIPTYKRPVNLRNALVSVARQDYTNKEILVVSDNGDRSEYNDHTREIVSKVHEDFPLLNIRLIEHKSNRNGASARNTAFFQSTGEYICFLDDDDIFLPGRLSKSIAELEKCSNSFAAVYCGFLGWNSPVDDPTRYKEGDLTEQLLLLNYKQHYLHTNTATYHRESVKRLNGFDESYRRHQDLEFNLRFFEFFETGVVSEALVRLNPEPSDVSNKMFGFNFFRLKDKFLSNFKPTLCGLENSVRDQVFDVHWQELIRYCQKEDVIKGITNSCGTERVGMWALKKISQ